MAHARRMDARSERTPSLDVVGGVRAGIAVGALAGAGLAAVTGTGFGTGLYVVVVGAVIGGRLASQASVS